MGILTLLDGIGSSDSEMLYVLEEHWCDVLANPDSPHSDIAMVQCVPSLVARARDSLAGCFRSGRGLPYNEPEVLPASQPANHSRIICL